MPTSSKLMPVEGAMYEFSGSHDVEESYMNLIAWLKKVAMPYCIVPEKKEVQKRVRIKCNRSRARSVPHGEPCGARVIVHWDGGHEFLVTRVDWEHNHAPATKAPTLGKFTGYYKEPELLLEPLPDRSNLPRHWRRPDAKRHPSYIDLTSPAPLQLERGSTSDPGPPSTPDEQLFSEPATYDRGARIMLLVILSQAAVQAAGSVYSIHYAANGLLDEGHDAPTIRQLAQSEADTANFCDLLSSRALGTNKRVMDPLHVDQLRAFMEGIRQPKNSTASSEYGTEAGSDVPSGEY